MPGMNLRLTDEQAAQLERWARESRRSKQQEVIHRLFDVTLSERAGGVEGSTMPSLAASQGADAPEADAAPGQEVGLTARSESVTPDWKPSKAEKRRR